MQDAETTLAGLVDHVVETDPGGVAAISLVGSAVAGGLRHESDVDVLVLTERSLSHAERHRLTDYLLRHSGRRATVTPGRPLEVTSLVVGDVAPWRYPPVCDFLYGEWLRDELAAGTLPPRQRNPDLAVLVTQARQHARRLHGQALGDLLAPVPAEDLRAAVRDSLDPLLADLVGDERNVLLTLARMLVTAESGRIVAKDQAARAVAPRLDLPDRAALMLASDGYLGDARDTWQDRQDAARRLADDLASRVRDAVRATSRR